MPVEMPVLCLMRLRLGMAVLDVANSFQTCKATVSKVLFVLYVKLPPIIIWQQGSELQKLLQ